MSLTQTFLTQRTRPLPFNLLLALSAEEECMGEHGMRTLLPQLGRIDMAIVGEPTGMQAAVGERGLVVLDCEARGKSGHAAATRASTRSISHSTTSPACATSASTAAPTCWAPSASP